MTKLLCAALLGAASAAALAQSFAGVPNVLGHVKSGRLHTEIAKALREPEVQANFRAGGVEATFMGPQELNTFMRAEYDKWGRVVRETGATVN